jgi:hypothetical protein
LGQADVQELIGWCNREELPVLNGRTTKVLRFLKSKVPAGAVTALSAEPD